MKMDSETRSQSAFVYGIVILVKSTISEPPPCLVEIFEDGRFRAMKFTAGYPDDMDVWEIVDVVAVELAFRNGCGFQPRRGDGRGAERGSWK